MTPAEELRAAAKRLRDDDFVPTEDFFRAVADLLDKVAWMGELDPDMLHRVGCDEAVAIARAYLAASPEPAAEEER